MIRYSFTHYLVYQEYVDAENVYSISGAKEEYKYNRLLVWDTFYWKRGQELLGRREKRFRSLLGFKPSFYLPLWRCGVRPTSYIWCMSHHRSQFAIRMDTQALHLLFPPKITPEEVEMVIGHLYDKIVYPIALKRLRLKARWFNK